MYVYYLHFINQASIDGLTSEFAHKGCYDVLEGQGCLKTQKFVRSLVYKKLIIFF